MYVTNAQPRRVRGWIALTAAAVTLSLATSASAQTAASTATNPSMEVYGFAMLDFGQNFKTINPNWYDTMRVSKLPKFDGEYGKDNSFFAGVRQTRLGVRTTTPTSLGDLKTTFEFELFGTGVDEGQTTFRLRHAYGELGQIGAGQYWSVFMDPDVFPNSLEYWGPTGMVFFRNIQLRYMPIKSDKQSVTIAIERPGASGDGGVYADRVELQNVQARFPMPDFTGQYTTMGNWGYFRAAGVLRKMNWDDTLDDQFDLNGDAVGWGLNLSTNLKPGKKDVIRASVLFGEGVQNYMNDSPVDIGIVNQFSNTVSPIRGEPIPIFATVFFLDHTWTEKYSSTIGFSHQDNDNTDGQAPDAFKGGKYFLANLLHYPAPNVMMGAEFQWGERENFGGYKADGVKIQFSFKYNFSHKFGG